jgi:hypothetical protein
MINLKINFKRLAPQVKTEGSALLVSIVLSALMLTVGIMSARLAVRELELSTDLFLSEKAYFSAESGVEKSLFRLKAQPLAHVEPTLTVGDIIPELEDDNTEVSIRNLIDTTAGNFPEDEFSFTLASLQSQRFRFQKDTDQGINTNNTTIDSAERVNIAVSGTGSRPYFWRFLCDDIPSGSDPITTITLQAATPYPTGTINNLLTEDGVLDDGTLENFNSWSGVDKDTCFLSIQNLHNTNPHTYTFSEATMAPHAAHIHAIGTHLNRTKHIRFDYAQSTLGGLFDFSFLHSDDGL